MVRPAFRARPLPDIERHFFFFMPAAGASFTRRFPPVDLHDLFTVLCGKVSNLVQEPGESQVADLASPEHLHGFHVQIFKAKQIIPPYQAIGDFPLEVLPTVLYAPVQTCQFQARASGNGYLFVYGTGSGCHA